MLLVDARPIKPGTVKCAQCGKKIKISPAYFIGKRAFCRGNHALAWERNRKEK